MARFFASTKTSAVACLVFVIMLALMVAPGSALAHAKLKSSLPADGSTVSTGLTSVTINLTEEISTEQSTAQLMHADNTAVSGATASVDRSDRTKMVISTPALAEGQYMVNWHAVTEDDNGISDGTIKFSVAAGATTQTDAPLPSAGGGEQYLIFMQTLAALALGTAVLGLVWRRRSDY